MEYSDKQIALLLEAVYDGRITQGNLPEDLYFAIANYLKKGLYEGYGGTLVDFTGKPFELLKELRENVYLFSGAKTYQTVGAMQAMVVYGEDKIRSRKEFKEFALKEYNLQNKTWANTEYDTAIGQGQNAYRWTNIVADARLFPKLRYNAVMDANTSVICRPLNGLIFDFNDPQIKAISPLNHYNCFLPNTKVLTPGGWVEISKVSVNDTVLGGSGKPQKVSFVHVNTFDGEMLNISVKGDSVTSTKNHCFLTLQGWKRAENICVGDIIIQSREVSNFNVPVSRVNNFNALLSYCLMPIIRKWKTRVVDALNSYSVIREKYINEFSSNRVVANKGNVVSGEMIAQYNLNISRGFMVHSASMWLTVKSFYCFFYRPFTYDRVKHRVVSFHTNRSIGKLFANMWVRPASHRFLKGVRSLFSSAIIFNPLRFNRFSTFARNIAKAFKPLHNSSTINAPLSPDKSKPFHVNEIHGMEGFTNGAPLNKFNSRFGFFIYSLWHNSFRLVESVSVCDYKGTIYNLSVNVDESYITNVGVVHNCRCFWEQLTDDYVLSNDRAEKAKEVESLMQDSFKMNPGQSGEVFGKGHPYFDVPKADKEYAKNNFNLPIPDKD